MKKIKLFYQMLLLSSICFSQNAFAQDDKIDQVILQGGIGIDQAVRGKSSGPFFSYEMEKSLFLGYMWIGMNMEGLHTVTRTIDTLTNVRKFYTTGLTFGTKLPKTFSSEFAGTGVGFTGIVLWDNFNLSPEFPFAFGPLMQIQYSVTEFTNFSLSIGSRCTYYIYLYKNKDSLDNGTATNPGVVFKVYVAVGIWGK